MEIGIQNDRVTDNPARSGETAWACEATSPKFYAGVSIGLRLRSPWPHTCWRDVKVATIQREQAGRELHQISQRPSRVDLHRHLHRL